MNPTDDTRQVHGAQTLPGRYYVDDELFAAERERIFQRQWVCAARADAVSRPGDFQVVQLCGENLILVRGDDNRVRCFYNVCRHRGSRICTESNGAADNLTCPYHGWTYRLDGTLRGAPNMQAEFDADQYPLHSVAAEQWNGFVFVNFASNPEPLAVAFASVWNHFNPWSLSELVVGAELEYDVAANWKLLFQNYNECYHCPRVHPALNAISPFKSASNDLHEGPFLGGPMSLADGVASMTETGRAVAEPLPELGPRQRRQVYYFTLFPSMFLSPHPDYVMVHYLRPQSPGRTLICCQFLFHPTAPAAAGFDPQPALTFWDRTNREDWRVCELCQQGVGSRAYTPGPYADLECTVAAFDNHYQKTLGTL